MFKNFLTVFYTDGRAPIYLVLNDIGLRLGVEYGYQQVCNALEANGYNLNSIEYIDNQ